MAKKWTEDELIFAINLYFKLPFGQQHSDNPKVRRLAEILDRTPGSVNMKLNQFAALDETLEQKGLTNYGKLDEKVWHKYWQNEEEVATRSEYILEQIEEQGRPESGQLELELEKLKENYGKEVRTDQKRRVGQRFFRRVVLANYEHSCCICRLAQPPLLEAAHIVNWSDTDDSSLRTNPRNGLAMCTLHHRAFDKQIISIHPEEKTVRLAPEIKSETTPGAKQMFHRFENKQIFIPEKLGPAQSLLMNKLGI